MPKTKYTQKELIDIFRARFRTQDRKGQIYFLPRLYASLFDAIENTCKLTKQAMNNWLDACIGEVYFELMTGEKVRLNDISYVSLVSCSKNIDASKLYGLPSSSFRSMINKNGKIKLSTSLQNNNRTIPSPKLCSSYTLYEVYLTRKNGNKCERVWLGDSLNLVHSIRELTLDHIQPVNQTLKNNRERLPYIMSIDKLTRAIYCRYHKSHITAIISHINTKDPKAYNGLIDEMMFVLRESHGIKICSPIANYNNK